MKQFHPCTVSALSWVLGSGLLMVMGAGRANRAADVPIPPALGLPASLGLSSVTNSPDTTPPTVPTNLTVLAVSPRKVVLGWDPATDDSGSVAYNLMRDGGLLVEGLSATNYTDLKVLPEQTYEYQVQAVDPSGNKSPFTPAVEAVTPAEQLVDTPGLLFEAWNDLNPPDLLTLTSDPRFLADIPDYRALATAADSRTVYADDTHQNYGGRLSGFLVPKDTGKYELFLRSEDASELWLSPDDQPANLVEIAEETGCCAPFQEPGDPRTSAPLTLVSGRKYAIEVLWTAGTGPGYAQVAWRKIDDPTPAGALYPIPADFLITPWDPTVGPPSVTNKTVIFPAVGTNATLQVQAIGEMPIAYQWAPFGGNPIPGATNDTLVFTNVALTDIGSVYTVTLQDTFGAASANYALIPNGSLFIEAEDFDFDAGRYVQDQPIGMTGPYPGGSYFGEGTEADNGIDYSVGGSPGTNDYRASTPVTFSSPNPQPDGLPRGEFDVQINYAVISAQPGDWFNYTRVFPNPPGDYYVYGRFASDTPVHARLDEVTSGAGSTNQLLQSLGEFRPGQATGGSNQFLSFPLVDAAGSMVTLTNWSGERTLRVTMPADSSPNLDYLFFVPTTPRPTGNSGFTSVTRAGNNLVLTWTTGILEWADSLAGPWQAVPNVTSPATFPLTGPYKFFRLR
jgi:PA14 domain